MKLLSSSTVDPRAFSLDLLIYTCMKFCRDVTTYLDSVTNYLFFCRSLQRDLSITWFTLAILYCAPPSPVFDFNFTTWHSETFVSSRLPSILFGLQRGSCPPNPACHAARVASSLLEWACSRSCRIGSCSQRGPSVPTNSIWVLNVRPISLRFASRSPWLGLYCLP